MKCGQLLNGRILGFTRGEEFLHGIRGELRGKNYEWR